MYRSYNTPKMIEGLQGKHVRDIACGSGYSTAITSNGELYTWGQGHRGQLGHGDCCSVSKPKQVGDTPTIIHQCSTISSVITEVGN